MMATIDIATLPALEQFPDSSYFIPVRTVSNNLARRSWTYSEPASIIETGSIDPVNNFGIDPSAFNYLKLYTNSSADATTLSQPAFDADKVTGVAASSYWKGQATGNLTYYRNEPNFNNFSRAVPCLGQNTTIPALTEPAHLKIYYNVGTSNLNRKFYVGDVQNLSQLISYPCLIVEIVQKTDNNQPPNTLNGILPNCPSFGIKAVSNIREKFYWDIVRFLSRGTIINTGTSYQMKSFPGLYV